MPAKPLWLFSDRVSVARRERLYEPFELSALTEAMISELRNVTFAKKKGRLEAKGSWRPVIQYDVSQRTFDQFFNSPYGYRGQYLIAPAVGVEANNRTLASLAGPLLGLSDLDAPLEAEARRSLLSPHAKIWIDEDHYVPNSPDLIVEILVPGWVTAATAIRERLDRNDSTLTPKEVDRIFGVRAPIGVRLTTMGAWTGPDGALSVVPSKLSRADDIHAYGIS